MDPVMTLDTTTMHPVMALDTTTMHPVMALDTTIITVLPPSEPLLLGCQLVLLRDLSSERQALLLDYQLGGWG